MASILKKRLEEGRGETLYEIGYDGKISRHLSLIPLEQGSTMKLSDQELTTAYAKLVKVAATLNADCSLIHKKTDLASAWVGIVMIRSRSDAVDALEIRVACLYPTMFP